MTYEEAKAIREDISRTRKTLKAMLDIYPRMPNGLTPDSTKALPGYQRTKAKHDEYWQAERRLNGIIAETFAAEIKAERRDRRHVA